MEELNIAFDRFTLKALLGKGSFGEVYRAYDPNFNKDVALKVLHQGLMQDLSFINKAGKEARLVQQIQHPNVVKIYEVGESAGRAYIEMEFIDGRPLSDFIKSGKRFNISQVVSFIEQISSALDATHAKQIVHRDVKPANILIDKSGIVHLVDFGLAHAAKSSLGSSSTTTAMGTAMYMSPEQAMGRTGDKSTDIYSLGIVAFELLTGRLPFEAENLPGYIAAHLNQKPPDPKKLNPAITQAVRDVLYKALSKSPAGRYKNASDFAQALHAASEKSDSSRGGALGCIVPALIAIVVGVLVIAGLSMGPFREQAQQVADNLISGHGFATDIPNYMPTRTPAVANTSTSIQPSATEDISSAPTLPQQSTEASLPPTLAVAPQATSTIQVIATPIPASGELTTLLGTGVRVETINNKGTGMIVRMSNGKGEPITGQYISIHTQKQDLAGNWVVDEKINAGYSDNAGQVLFDVSPGNYIVASDFTGYNWGSAAGVNGQANLSVQNGSATQLTISLGRLTIGFLRGDGSVITGQYVEIHKQKKDLAGNWVEDDRVSAGYTDNAGLYSVDLTSGYYIVASDFPGYNWGNARDVKGMASVAIQPGLQNPIMVISFGQLQVGLKDVNGNPYGGQYVQVFLQKKDVSGAPALGDQVQAGYTDNTGIYTSNLTQGQYAIKVGEQTLFNIEVGAGKITVTDGTQWQFKP